jgi:N-acetylglucosaminyl-diphospho-decaprenol L-rhamnosyltransferase
VAGRCRGDPPYCRAVVTVAVVSYNTRELLLRCLDSLAAEVAAGGAEVWVIDNGSSDRSAAAARLHAPWAHVIDAETNLGFGSAVNEIVRRSTGEWLLIANADVALEAGALDTLLARGADARVGVLAPRLVLPDGGTQHSVHPFPTIPVTLAVNLGLPRLSRRLADHLCLEERWNPERPRTVPWALGACLLVRRRAFEAVGGFDERQWMYAEDLDLGWRLREAGWITGFEPRARVRHEASAATSAAFGEERVTRFMAATYAMLRRRRGAGRMWATLSLNVLGAALRSLWLWPLARCAPAWRGREADNRRWLWAHVRAAGLTVSR